MVIVKFKLCSIRSCLVGSIKRFSLVKEASFCNKYQCWASTLWVSLVHCVFKLNTFAIPQQMLIQKQSIQLNIGWLGWQLHWTLNSDRQLCWVWFHLVQTAVPSAVSVRVSRPDWVGFRSDWVTSSLVLGILWISLISTQWAMGPTHTTVQQHCQGEDYSECRQWWR